MRGVGSMTAANHVTALVHEEHAAPPPFAAFIRITPELRNELLAAAARGEAPTVKFSAGNTGTARSLVSISSCCTFPPAVCQ